MTIIALAAGLTLAVALAWRCAGPRGRAGARTPGATALAVMGGGGLIALGALAIAGGSIPAAAVAFAGAAGVVAGTAWALLAHRDDAGAARPSHRPPARPDGLLAARALETALAPRLRDRSPS